MAENELSISSDSGNRLAVRKIPYKIADLKCDVQQKNKNDSNLRGFFFEKGGGDTPFCCETRLFPLLYLYIAFQMRCAARNTARIENSGRLRGAVRNLCVIFAELWNIERCTSGEIGVRVSQSCLLLVFIYMGMWWFGSLFVRKLYRW